jgi:hypothetical protein
MVERAIDQNSCYQNKFRRKKKKTKTVCIIELIKHGVHLLEKDISPPPSCGFFFLQFPEKKKINL